jgi:peptidoglycan/LPS O-acetylase OafA/YrhL
MPYIAASLGKRSGRFDKVAGDLAYPLYLLHWPMFIAAARIAPGHIVPVAVVMTIAATLALSFAVDRPLEAWR